MGAMKKLDVSLLIVEDERYLLEMLAEYLQERVQELYLAKDGGEGLELYDRYHPEVVLTDIQMPVMNGLDMARRIKADDPDVQIIVVSAHADSHYFMDSIEIDVSQYVLKLFRVEKIFSALDRCADIVILKRKIREQREELARSEARYRALAEHAPFGMLLFDEKGAPQYVNPRFSEITGYRLDNFKDGKERFGSFGLKVIIPQEFAIIEVIKYGDHAW